MRVIASSGNADRSRGGSGGRRGISGFGVDEALRTYIEELRRRVQTGISSELEQRNIGLVIEGVDVKEILPPRQVIDAFNSVIRADLERSTNINEARKYANRIVSDVKGEAARVKSEAATYKTRVVESAKADEHYLRNLLQEYPGEPEKLNVFLDQLYQEVLGEVIAGTEERFIIGEGDEGEIRYIIGPER